MKPLTIFILKRCPYCIKAKKYLAEYLEQEKYEDIEIEFVDERKEKERAGQYDYYYVPSFYVGDQKLHEGAIKQEQLGEVLDKYLEKRNDD